MPSDKFVLRALNYLAYNWVKNSLLITSYLLELLDHYTLSDSIKSINLVIFQKRFLGFAIHIYKTRLIVNNLLQLWH